MWQPIPVMRDKINTVIGFHRRILGVNIGEDLFKLAEMEIKAGQKILTNIAVAPCGTDMLEQRELLQNILLTNGFSARKAILGISGRNIFFREVMFPQMDSRELQEAVKWEIGRYIPYDEDTYYYDFTVTADEAEMGKKVVLFAAPKEYIDGLLALFADLEIEITAIDGELFALSRFVETECAVVVDIGNTTGQVVVYQANVPISNRYFSLKNIEKTANNLNLQIADEILKVWEYHKIQNRAMAIHQVYCCGNIAENSCGQIAQLTGLPAALLEPLRTFTIASYFNERYIETVSQQAASAIGLLLRRDAR